MIHNDTKVRESERIAPTPFRWAYMSMLLRVFAYSALAHRPAFGNGYHLFWSPARAKSLTSFGLAQGSSSPEVIWTSARQQS